MTTLETLIAARDLLSDPARWAKEFFAFDADGECVDSSNETAVCWCALGAIEKINGSITAPTTALLDKAAGSPIIAFNDATTTTHADVMKVFDAAIDLARGEAE